MLQKDDLDFQPGKDPIERNPHVTLHVMLPHLPGKELQAKICKFKQFPVKLDGVGYFENKESDVLYIKVVVSEELKALHDLLVAEYKQPWQHKEYTPHVTLAFTKKSKAREYAEKILTATMILRAEKVVFEQHASASKDKADVLALALAK